MLVRVHVRSTLTPTEFSILCGSLGVGGITRSDEAGTFIDYRDYIDHMLLGTPVGKLKAVRRMAGAGGGGE